MSARHTSDDHAPHAEPAGSGVSSAFSLAGTGGGHSHEPAGRAISGGRADADHEHHHEHDHDHGDGAGGPSHGGHEHVQHRREPEDGGPSHGGHEHVQHRREPEDGGGDHADHDHDHDRGHHHGHDHDRGDGHDHDRGDGHDHEHGRGLWSRLSHLVTPHSHDTAAKVDSAMETSRDGLRALWISLAVLGATAVLQAVVFLFSGSVALLGDTLHNVADALTAVPLAIAFLLGRRLPTRRYTYGYGRAEDLAGIVIVVFIAASAVVAAYEAIQRLLHPADVRYLGYVALAAVIGFAGNEIVARYRISVGRRIGSAALIADGMHARTDGFTSLAVLLGAGGVAIGWTWADPVVGLAISVAIAFVLFDAARQVYRRLMDAVDPDLVDRVSDVLAATPGVIAVGDVHLRWIGHQLRAECEISVEPQLPVARAHAIAVDAEHRLIHAVPRLTRAFVHADPAGDDELHHAELSHHEDNRHGSGPRRSAVRR